MKNLKDKLVRMIAAILEITEVEPASFDVASTSPDELATDNEHSADHKLIELCW
jgi:hypothetical protein